MAAVPDFHNSLALGKKYENVFLRLLNPSLIEAYFVPVGYFRDYDLFVRMKGAKGTLNVTYEVKADTYAHKTNAIAIEYECGGRPSGIMTTTAAFWIQFIVGTRSYVMIPTRVLRKMIFEDGLYEVRRGGDYNSSYLYIVSLDDIDSKYKHTFDEEVEDVLKRPLPYGQCPDAKSVYSAIPAPPAGFAQTTSFSTGAEQSVGVSPSESPYIMSSNSSS